MPYSTARSARRVLPGIWQDGPNRFRVRARWTDETGRRRKREGVAASLEEAVALQKTLRSEEGPRRATRERFNDYAQRWLVENADRFQPSTLERYTVALAHATAAFGVCYVDALTVAELRRWVNGMVRDCSPATINGRLRVLRQVLEPLVDDDVLAANPARKIRALPEGRTKGKRGTALTAPQLRAFVETTRAMMGSEIAEDVGRMLLCLAFTGMRRAECFALSWADWTDGELRVERAVWRRTVKSTKTDDPRRVAVVGPLVEVFREQRLWLEEVQHPGRSSGLMFPASPRHAKASATRRKTDEVCWYRTGSVLDAPLAKVVRTAGIPSVSPHSFRRTFENMLRQAGVDGLVRRAMAGWRSDDAQAIYASVDRTERDAAANRVVQLVMGAPGKDELVRPAGTPAG